MNYTTISFPSLEISLDPPRTFSLGPVTLHLYGLVIAVGLLLAVLYSLRRCKQFGLKQDVYRTIQEEDLLAFLSRVVRRERCALSIIKPIEVQE